MPEGPFESDALKGASSEAAREMKPFIEAVMELRKMPDAPKNSADIDIVSAAFREWRDRGGDTARLGAQLPWLAFMAGWRAAMAEVKKERDHLDQIVRDERAEKARYDHSREGF